MTATIRRHRRLSWLGLVLVLGVIGLAGSFAAGSGAAQSPETEESEPEDETATPLPTVPMPPTPTLELEAPTPAAWIPPTPETWKPVEAPSPRAFGLVDAEPYRVFTGDGDCLNLRNAPGTLFGGDPRTCVPEGFLLWLFGPEKQADGMTWRYALGEGWVATQYVEPAPDAVRGMGPFESVTVSQFAGDGTASARITSGGATFVHPWLPFASRGLGSSPPAISDDARWAAYTRWDTAPARMTVLDRQSGTEQNFPSLVAMGWSSQNTLLVRDDSRQSLGWMSPESGVVNEIPNSRDFWGSWAPDGQSLIGAVEGSRIVRLSLDGTRQEYSFELEEGAYLGELSISPDGTKVLSASFLGDIRIIDLVTGTMTVLARAPQFEGGGKCGGSTGKLSGWLDDNTAVWHESYGPRGQNGITIATVDGGIQRVIPFFNIQDLKVVAPGLISFTTWEWSEDQPELILTWLLETRTGEGRPVTVGGFGVWH